MAYMTPSPGRALRDVRRLGAQGGMRRDFDGTGPGGFGRRRVMLGAAIGGAVALAIWAQPSAHARGNAALGTAGLSEQQAAPAPDLATAALPGSVTAEPNQPAPNQPAPANARPAEALPDATPPARRPAKLAAAQPNAPAEIKRGPVTRMAIPRYVSFKGSIGNVRRGPSRSHRIDWVLHHSGMPLQIVGEFGHWRRVVDRDGAGGWMYYQLLSGVRTAVVQRDMVELRARPDLNAGVIAMAEDGAILKLGKCNTEWCRVSGGGARGWVQKVTLWGVDPDEIRD